MKIALTSQRPSPLESRPFAEMNIMDSDRFIIGGKLMIQGPQELKVVGQPLHVFDTVELSDKEAALIRRMISSGDSDARDTLNSIISKVASSAFYKGNSAGHNEAVMER